MKIASIVAGIVALIAAVIAQEEPIDDSGDVDMLIVGGTEMPVGQALYTVGIRKTEDGALFCGGSLIDERHVLTAAHCSSAPMNYVSIGSHYARGNIDGVRVAVKSGTKHPDNFPYFFLYDFFMLELAEPVDTKKYPPVKLANPSGKDVVDDRTATVIGWGYTNKTQKVLSNVLLKVDLPLMTEPTCEKVFDVFGPMICTKGDKEHSPCNGDSGGPLVVKDKDGSDILVGVVSWGYGCGEQGTPGVYGMVSNVTDWIKSLAPNAVFSSTV